jgi:hypothetical protein
MRRGRRQLDRVRRPELERCPQVALAGESERALSRKRVRRRHSHQTGANSQSSLEAEWTTMSGFTLSLSACPFDLFTAPGRQERDGGARSYKPSECRVARMAIVSSSSETTEKVDSAGRHSIGAESPRAYGRSEGLRDIVEGNMLPRNGSRDRRPDFFSGLIENGHIAPRAGLRVVHPGSGTWSRVLARKRTHRRGSAAVVRLPDGRRLLTLRSFATSPIAPAEASAVALWSSWWRGFSALRLARDV